MYGDIALEGTDDNDVSYSLFGKNISIRKKDGEGVEIVSVTGDSVTVSPLGGQQYQYSTDGAT